MIDVHNALPVAARSWVLTPACSARPDPTEAARSQYSARTAAL